MPAPDVVFALVGDVRRNSRALKQLRTLVELGATVEVLTLGPPPEDPWLEKGIRLRVVHDPPGAGPLYFWRIHRRMQATARAIPARVYHASDLYTLPAMHAAARRHGGRLAFDARELYPHLPTTVGKPWARAVWHLVQRAYLRRADAVFTVSQSIAEHLGRTYGIAPPAVLYNAPPACPVAPSNILRQRLGLPEDVVILLHSGHVRVGRHAPLLVDVMLQLHGAVLVFLGDGPLRPLLEERVRERDLQERVYFLDPVPPDDLLPVVASADVGLVLLENTCLNLRYALPNKLFEYLTAGLPVLASDLPELRRVVAQHEVGCLVNPDDLSALTRMLQRMIDDAEARRRWAAHAPHAVETFSWNRTSKLFKQIYQSLLPVAAP